MGEETTIEKVYLLHGFMGTARLHFSNQIARWKDCYELIPFRDMEFQPKKLQRTTLKKTLE